ncbi:MAG TPA: hypothetical protein VNU45_18135 [Rummeliibacillus sp.]|nr:hypothetical protein [Rummeliibacillus sp.]
MTDGTQDKLYAGKFKTVEELEAGYNNAAKVYQENDDLKSKYTQATTVPDDYQVPANVALHDNDVAQLKQAAKESGLTQAQFEKLASKQNDNVRSKFENFENSKKEIGVDNLNLLQDFLNKTYPDKVAEKMLNEAIKNKDIRDQILEQRTKTLNSSVPGVNRVSSGSYNEVTHEDVIKSREVMLKSRGRARVEAQKRYIALSSQLAHANE